jgi:hypothetical protein
MQRERHGSIAVLTPEGPRALAGLRAAAEEAAASDAATLLVDLARAPALRGDEIEALTDAAFVCEKARKGLALASVSREVRTALDVLALGRLFPYVYPDRAAALSELERALIAPPGEPPMEIGF